MSASIPAYETIKSDEDFDNVFTRCTENNQAIAVYFTASWCGPCKKITPVFNRLAESSNQDPLTKNLFVFFKADIEDCPETSRKFGVTSIPSFHVFHHGVEMNSCKGANEKALVNLLQSCYVEIMTPDPLAVVREESAYI